MPRRRSPRPSSILCASCTAPVAVAVHGPLPTRCSGCVEARALRMEVSRLDTGTIPVGVESRALARVLKAAGERLIYQERKP